MRTVVDLEVLELQGTQRGHSNNWHRGGTQSCLLEIWTSRVRLSCKGPPDQFRKSASSDSFLDVISDGAF